MLKYFGRTSPSLTLLGVAQALMILKVDSSMRTRCFSQARRFDLRCWRIFHSPSP
jgi:hypothetical protein